MMEGLSGSYCNWFSQMESIKGLFGAKVTCHDM